MSKKRKPLLPFLSLAALLVVGALNRQPLFSFNPVEPSPVPAPESAAGVWANWDATPQQVFADFQSRYGRDKMTWLRLNVWQRMRLPDIVFESDSRIVLGPTRCAHLSMKLQSGAGTTIIQVVSDGKTIAKSVRVGQGKPRVTTTSHSTRDAKSAAPDPLAVEGCCGPASVLDRVMPQLNNLSVQKHEHLIRVVGETTSEATKFQLPAGRPLRCRLYFDEKSHWLTRIEWAFIEASGERTFLEMEYRNPIINEPLTDEECIREFTFRIET